MKKINSKRVQTEIIESIKEYYKNNIIDLKTVTRLNFRHFRYRLPDGYFFKVKEKIRNPENLKKSLIANEPLDVYYSTATWLNPHLIGSKLDNDILKNIMLSCDLAFDIDINKDNHTLEATRVQAIALTDYLKSVDIPVRYSAFSGSKGFHIVCNDPWIKDIIEEDPRKREASAVLKRKEVVRDAKNNGLYFDEKVTIDTRRIIRVPGTINSKTGYVCTVLSKKELESDLETIFKLVPSVGSFAPRISLNRREMTDPSVHKISGSMGRLGVRPRPKLNYCYSTFYTSNIPETVLKIPVLEFGTWMKIETVDAIVNRVQDHYGLGDMFLFSDKTRYWAVSLKAVSQRRIEKILFAADSLNLNQCKKYGCAYVRVGKSVDVDGNVVQDAPLFLRVIESDLRGQASRPHYEFFSSLGLVLRENMGELCGAGKEKLEIVHAIIE